MSNASGQPLAGEPSSLWVATIEATEFSTLTGDIHVDVAVIGGGIAGLTTALSLKRAGRSVAVLEIGRVGTGVTGHTTGKVTSLHRLTYRDLWRHVGHDEARGYGQANQFAIEHVASVVDGENIDCEFRRVDNYTYAESSTGLDMVREEVNIAQRLGLPASYVTATPLPFAVAGAIRFTDQAKIHAGRYVQGLARAVDGDGSHVFENTQALDVREGSPCVVTVEGGRVRARDVVVATNMPFLDRGAFFLRCHPQRSYLVAGRADSLNLDATFISVEEPLRSIMPTNVGDDTYLLIGGEGHRVSERGDTVARYQRLIDYARTRFGIEDIAYRWSTQDAVPLDGMPYAGTITPWSKHVYVITGLKKWGLSNGTAAALIVADEILDRPNPWAKLFNSNRLSLSASAGRFLHENLLSAKQVITTRLKSAPSRTELAPDTAGIFVINGEKVAVHKDIDGLVHAVSAICTHQGCTVDWNGADRTWDCPCHGSRFQPDGQVRQGPAAKELPRREVPGV